MIANKHYLFFKNNGLKFFQNNCSKKKKSGDVTGESGRMAGFISCSRDPRSRSPMPDTRTIILVMRSPDSGTKKSGQL
jgi:hypothetical protein